MKTIASASAAAFAALVLTLPIAAHAACRIETLDLPVKMIARARSPRWASTARPFPLTVDSGAFFSVLTQAAATQLDLRTRQFPALRVEGIAGRMDARVTTVDKLQLAKGDISRVDFVVGGNEPGAGTIVSLGLDTFVDDPISKFGLLAGDFSKLGARLGQLNLPTVFILEGGYAVAELGINAASVLDAFDHE